MIPDPSPDRTGPGTAALLATGCGTAIACVCALGLFQIERTLGGLWSVLAVAAGGSICLALAAAFGRLCNVVPTGAGVLAYLSKGLGRRAGLLLAVPYVLLMLFLVGAEASIVGVLIARLAPVPPPVAALAFLIVTWLVCRAGVRLGYRAQGIATWALVLCLAALAVYAVAGAASRGDLAARMLHKTPTLLDFVSGVGQSIFLFMGFELVTSQVEIARSPASLRRSLLGSVLVLTLFYASVSLGYSCLPEGAVANAESFVPQLAIAEQAGSSMALLAAIVLSLLASFTSFNGSLLGLSRFTYALGSQGVLPRRFAKLDPVTLVPREGLFALLLLAVGATALVWFGGAMYGAILAAAVAASLVYAGAAWVREGAPFAEKGRPAALRFAGRGLAVLLALLAAGVLAGAGHALVATLLLLAAAYGAAAVAGWRMTRPVPAKTLLPIPTADGGARAD